ncbi:MAG: hypothetical protein HDR30_02845, partial [Lachnospiraceae bacterium]|nr:hypothetical protein [Lachnospiraceae bacterium]
IDEEESDEYDTVFAPGGDMEEAGVCFVVSEVEEAFGIIDMFLEDMDEMQEIMEEDMTDERDFAVISDLGITFLGRTLTIEVSIHDAEDDEAGNTVMYIAEDDNNMYMFFAFSAFEDEEETAGLSEAAQEAVEMFFETGRVTDSFT